MTGPPPVKITSMSSPGGPDNRGRYSQGFEQYHDPVTGQPVNRSGHPGYGGHPHGWDYQHGPAGMQYQGFGMFDRQRQQQAHPHPGMVGGHPVAMPPRRSRAPVIAAISVAAVVAISIVTTVVLINSGGPGNVAAPAGPPSPVPEPTVSSSSASASASSIPASRTENVREPVPPAVPGWRGMALPEFGVAYDIPPGWKPETGSLSGFENESGERVTMSGYSSYMRDFCPEADLSFRARVGLTGSNDPDPVVAADNAIREWARMGWGTETGVPPDVTPNPVEAVTVDGGLIEAKLVSGTVTPAEPGPCSPPSVYVGVLAVPTTGDKNAALLIGIADQGVPGAVPPADINRSLTSLRLLPD